MIKYFTFEKYINAPNKAILFPLLRNLYYEVNKSGLENFYSFHNDINSSDIVIIPLDINYFFENRKVDELWFLINKRKNLQQPIWVFSSGDIGKTFKAPVYTFRLGGFNSKLDEKTFILPAFIQDPYSTFLNKEFQPLKKEEIPCIGFAGHANGSLLKWIKEFSIFLLSYFKRIKTNKSFDFQSFFPSGRVRYKMLMNLFQNTNIQTDFIFRSRYRAGAKTKEQKHKTTLEFYDNIERTPYTLCIRGAGNFSIRLYEVLAMGRIPVLVKSDFRLPLPWVDWEKHCLITEKENIEKTILAFHKSCTPKEFIKLQESNKNFWREKLSLEGYFKEIHDFFKKDNL